MDPRPRGPLAHLTPARVITNVGPTSPNVVGMVSKKQEGRPMRTRIWLGLLVSVIAGPTAAQEKPDFTGEWVLMAPYGGAMDAAPELSVRQWLEHKTSVRGVPIDIPHVTIERQFQTGVRSESYQIGIVGGMTSGSISANVPGVRTQYAVKWDGDRLVIETGRYSGPTRESGPYSEHDEVWSLDAQGTLVMTVTDRGSGTETRTTQLTYRKR
jgi:hypothetical protein